MHPQEKVAEFEALFARILETVDDVEGWMAVRELELLALLAAFPTARGTLLEIGSFRGRSTTALALAAEYAGDSGIVACDPLPNVGPMREDEDGHPSARALIEHNLTRTGVRERVELNQMLSSELAPSWDRELRFLWIDGDHTYAGAKLDFDAYSPYLTDGAIVAFHDVLHENQGPVRVFCEDVLLSPHYGPTGFVGSIGWAQYFADPSHAEAYRDRNLGLYKRLSRLIPFVAFDRNPAGLARPLYRLARSRVPHKRVRPEDWIRTMVSSPSTTPVPATPSFQPVVVRA